MAHPSTRPYPEVRHGPWLREVLFSFFLVFSSLVIFETSKKPAIYWTVTDIHFCSKWFTGLAVMFTPLLCFKLIFCAKQHSWLTSLSKYHLLEGLSFQSPWHSCRNSYPNCVFPWLLSSVLLAYSSLLLSAAVLHGTVMGTWQSALKLGIIRPLLLFFFIGLF